MPHRLLGAAALALGLALVGAAPLAAQRTDSVAAPHVMATVVVNGARERRASLAENVRLQRELARYDARIVSLQGQLDSLKSRADSLDRDRVYFEAAAAQARMRRSQVEQRLRDVEGRSAPGSGTQRATP
jgi:chromosome segregation ATPase